MTDLTKPNKPAPKPGRCKPPPKPTIDQYRDWYHYEMRRANDLKAELAKAKAIIDALAYTLAYRTRLTPDAGEDIPF